MPNLDGGHYFLTAVVPVRTDLVDRGGDVKVSHVNVLRQELATLATARQSPSSNDDRLDCAFARSTRTHFARLFVLDDVAYNGREPVSTIVTAVRKEPLTESRPVDHLSCPFLIVVVDFDPDPAGGNEPAHYLAHLWAVMERELRAIFEHCVGFEAVRDGAAFAQYVRSCQIETTMPFNDYWTAPPPLPSLKPLTLVAPAGAAALVAVVAAVAWAIGGFATAWVGWVALAGAVATVAAIAWAYLTVMSKGNVPFPAAPGSDLPSVLKALYLQQQFTRFAIDNQLANDEELHARFQRFVRDHAPGTVGAPTQRPGVIRS